MFWWFWCVNVNAIKINKCDTPGKLYAVQQDLTLAVLCCTCRAKYSFYWIKVGGTFYPTLPVQCHANKTSYIPMGYPCSWSNTLFQPFLSHFSQFSLDWFLCQYVKYLHTLIREEESGPTQCTSKPSQLEPKKHGHFSLASVFVSNTDKHLDTPTLVGHVLDTC